MHSACFGGAAMRSPSAQQATSEQGAEVALIPAFLEQGHEQGAERRGAARMMLVKERLPELPAREDAIGVHVGFGPRGLRGSMWRPGFTKRKRTNIRAHGEGRLHCCSPEAEVRKGGRAPRRSSEGTSNAHAAFAGWRVGRCPLVSASIAGGRPG